MTIWVTFSSQHRVDTATKRGMPAKDKSSLLGPDWRSSCSRAVVPFLLKKGYNTNYASSYFLVRHPA